MRLRGHTSGYLLEAIAAIDIALWDAAGKAAGVPIAKLLGAQIRDRIPVYASSLARIHRNQFDEQLQQMLLAARNLIDQGYRAIKVKVGINLDLDCEVLRCLRAEVGTDITLMVDANGAYDPALARQAGDLLAQAGDIRWLEEPLAPELLGAYAPLTAYLDVAVAGGECLTTRWAFKEYLASGAFDIIQPDVSRAGGISECKRIAELADVFGVPVAPHVSTGTAIYVAATLQWAAATPNLMICEYPLGQELALNAIQQSPFVLNDGCIRLPELPGLGIEINESALRQWESVK
jgi:L-alanine-DL-glutamate epimerase-like enolase superfamily enzyme